MRSLSLLPLLFAASALSGPPPPKGATPVAPAPMMKATDFRQLQGGPEHRGHMDVPPIAKPRIRWAASVGIQGWLNAPVVQGNTVVVPSSGTIWNKPDPADGLVALDTATGNVRWRFETPNDANGAAIHPGMNMVVVTCDDSHIYAVDLTTGQKRWSHRGKGKMYTHPLVLGDLVVVGDGGGTLWALSPVTGEPVFKHRLRGSLRGGAVSNGKLIVAVSTQGDAIAVDLAGKRKWRKTLVRPGWDGSGKEPIDAYAAPTLVGDMVVVTFARDTTFGRPAVIALNLHNGHERWRAADTRPSVHNSSNDWGNVRTSPAVAHGRLLYAEPYSGDLVAIDTSSGAVTERAQVGECMFPHWASPVIARDVVYVPRFDGALVAADVKTLQRRWALYLGDPEHTTRKVSMKSHSRWGCEWQPKDKRSLYASPALGADGTLYVGNGHDTLYAIENGEQR
jgi:outer membrane protein assembly factor BamB